MDDISPPRPVDVSHRHTRLAILRNILAAWDARTRFRRSLVQTSKDNPHLIADIGLTKRQVAAEIAKPFWRV